MAHNDCAGQYIVYNLIMGLKGGVFGCRIAPRSLAGQESGKDWTENWEHVIRERDPNIFLVIASHCDRVEIQKHHTRFIEGNGGQWEDILSNFNYKRG